MNMLSYMDNQLEEDSMAYVFSKKKEAYRVSIRKQKLNQAFNHSRLRTNNKSNQALFSNQEIQFYSEDSNTININRESIQYFFSQSSSPDNLIQKILVQFQRIISSFQGQKQNDLSSDQFEELKQQITLVVDIEQITQKQIIKLNDISFILRLISDNQILTQNKLILIEILGVLYGSQGIQQYVIQYLIQYLNMENLSLIEKILDFFQQTLVSETQNNNILFMKLNKSFFVKIIFRLLNLKCEKISIQILSIASQLIKNDQNNKFLTNLIENKSMLSQQLNHNLELKNKDLMIKIKQIIINILNRIDEQNEELQAYIQSLIDSNLINKLFEIFISQSREYSFLKQLIIIIFSKSNHFQIEHFFDPHLKYFIMNHMTNYLVSSSKEETLQMLQFIHQILFEEKEYNQQNYYPRKKIIQSLEIQMFIQDYSINENEYISKEAKFILNYL